MPAELDPPFRAEVIGSLLRPRSLKDMAREVEAGRKKPEDLAMLLESEVARVVRRQEDLGLAVLTDGELGRTSWFGFFFEGMRGFRLEPSQFRFKDSEGAAFEWPTCMAEARIERTGPITIPEFERARRHARRALVKATMPSPSAFHFFRLSGSVDKAVYPSMSAFFDDLVGIYQTELKELARAGCRYLQLDEVPVAMMCDHDVCSQAAAQGEDAAKLLDTYIDLTRRIVSARPEGMTVGMHLCRGNFRGRWMAAGGYEPIADKLFNAMPVDAFYLEYDSERAGGFEPLRFVPRGKRVVLGLVSSKTARLEDEAALLRRIELAAKHIPLDQLALSTQCGFASVAGGNILTEDEQWAKLDLVVRTARKVWGSA